MSAFAVELIGQLLLTFAVGYGVGLAIRVINWLRDVA